MAAEAKAEKASADARRLPNSGSSGSEPLFKDEDDIFDFLRGELQVH